ncbi:MAG: hypothetical protein ACI837_001352 [Crocinitomicaceae bacterium]|jgi:hypothetical protein
MRFKHLLPALILVFFACSSPQEAIEKITSNPENQVSVIQPIHLDGVENGPIIYKVNAQHPEVIKIKRGGTLVFDKDAFVDGNGNPVKGEVDVEWQEFHSLGDIMLSGIPMKYDSASIANNLVSGGMFTINASQGSSPVHIAPNKSVEVNLASIQDTPCYNFYELDEKSGDWSYETTKGSTPIETEEDVVDAPESTKPADPNLLDVTLDTRKFAELKGLDIVAWRSKRALSPMDKRLLAAKSSAIRLIKTDSLGLTLEARTAAKEILQYPVEPYLMKDAQADSKGFRKEMNADLAETRKYTKDIAGGEVVRSISIDNFGTYNWDCVHQFEDPQRVMASFSFPLNVSKKLITVFLIAPDRNLVIQCNSEGDNNFFFDPEDKNCLIGILPNNEIVSVSNKGFDEIRSRGSGQEYTFSFKKTGIKLSSPADIMDHLNVVI